jgi:hypothetical protein
LKTGLFTGLSPIPTGRARPPVGDNHAQIGTKHEGLTGFRYRIDRIFNHAQTEKIRSIFLIDYVELRFVKLEKFVQIDCVELTFDCVDFQFV